MIFQSQSADSSASNQKEKKASSRAKPGQHHHSIISSDLTIKGNLVCTGDLRVEGRVDGDITCRTLTLGAQPVINSKVTAETVRICGEFTGEVRARKVVLTDSAKVKGDIYQDVLQLDKGAAFEGYIGRLGGETAKAEDEVTALKSA